MGCSRRGSTREIYTKNIQRFENYVGYCKGCELHFFTRYYNGDPISDERWEEALTIRRKHKKIFEDGNHKAELLLKQRWEDLKREENG